MFEKIRKLFKPNPRVFLRVVEKPDRNIWLYGQWDDNNLTVSPQAEFSTIEGVCIEQTGNAHKLYCYILPNSLLKFKQSNTLQNFKKQYPQCEVFIDLFNCLNISEGIIHWFSNN